jgi:hypothetical protein
VCPNIQKEFVSFTVQFDAKGSTHFQRSTRYFLDANHVEGKQIIKHQDSIDNHLGEEIFLLVDQLRAHSGSSTFLKQLSQFCFIIFLGL